MPLNLGRECKTRLAGHLSPVRRRALVTGMADHVIAELRAVAAIAEVLVLSPEPPDLGGAGWLQDQGRGLNAELAKVLVQRPVLVIHADLPLLAAAEVEVLLAAAERAGAALAPDRAGSGTNALALATAGAVTPRFGPDSLALHRALLPHATLVHRPGLACDVDTPDDLDRARAAGARCIAVPI